MFKRMILILLTLGAALLAAQESGRWTHYATGGEGSNASYYYLDASTVHYRASPNGPIDYASIWIKITKPSGGFILQHIEQHYTTRHYRFWSAAEYDASGNLTYSNDTPGKWNEIIPESVADALFHRLWRVDD